MVPLPSRQVHLDFHTSEAISAVGERFDKRRWQRALRLGCVNSITIFAKCHHGWSYYPTRVGQRHPSVKRNLLGEQIAACHEIGVRAPIYFTVGWSANDAEEHPAWCVRKRDGSIARTAPVANVKPSDPRPPGSWTHLCPSGRYLDLILRQTAEICGMFDVDGVFYDITNGPPCYCPNCLGEMKDSGLDCDNDRDVIRQNIRKWHRLMDECNRVVHGSHEQATVFYNGTAGIYQPWMHDRMTHYELEDLPTTWGGYEKFPLRSRYFANKGSPFSAMTGKFHTWWGEFGGFKHPDALRFEAAAMIAYGARCSIGDQLHPSGELDPATYRNIGAAYKYVRRIEEYGLDGQPASTLGLWLSGPGEANLRADVVSDDQGTVNMLLESQMDFRVVDPGGDLDGFEAIVMTGNVRLDKKSADRVKAFLRRGGGLLVMGQSGLDEVGRKFMIDVGAKYLGPARYQQDYLVVGGRLGTGLVESPFLCYSAASRVQVTTGRVLATIREPYFDRTVEHYCSHQNTPNRLIPASHPGAVRKGKVVYLAHRLGDMYYNHGARLHRDLFRNTLRLVYPRPTLWTQMPSAAQVTIIHQANRRRYVAHLLYGPSLKRGRCLVIEDLVPLRNVPVELRVSEKIRRVHLVPQEKPLPVRRLRGAVRVIVPEVACHQAVVFQY
jgi:hypothetical protein